MNKLRYAIKGFTLLELMAVVAIVGILAVVAIPSFQKYMQKSKSTEAALNLRKIFDGESVYYQYDHTLDTGLLADKQFVSFEPIPVTPGRNKVNVDFTAAGWDVIQFTSDSPVLYSYSVATTGVNQNAAFTARAQGDIDGDGSLSLFERVGTVDSSGDIIGGSAIYSLDPHE